MKWVAERPWIERAKWRGQVDDRWPGSRLREGGRLRGTEQTLSTLLHRESRGEL
jgi:hypothetical protein